MNVVLNIPLVIPHQDKSNFVNRPQYGSNELSIEQENECQYGYKRDNLIIITAMNLYIHEFLKYFLS